MAKMPTPEQIRTLLEGPADTPVTMLNLLKFHRVAEGSGGGETGEGVYAKYAANMLEYIASKGARLIWSGRVDSLVIGDTDERFDMIALVEYPSRRAFLEIAASEHVREIGVDRSAGLEHQWLLACTQSGS